MEALAAAIIIVLAISYVVVRAIVFAQALRQLGQGRRAGKDGAPDRPVPAPPADEQGERSAED